MLENAWNSRKASTQASHQPTFYILSVPDYNYNGAGVNSPAAIVAATEALWSLTHDWFKELDNGNEICSVFFDLRKAFDSVPHAHLVDKLTSLNLCPHLLQWIHSYLSGRSQVVAVGGELSSVKNVASGVPQGSVLGPLLFIIYIDDVVTQISPSSSISLYADDIALYRSISSPSDYVVLQADITAITMLYLIRL